MTMRRDTLVTAHAPWRPPVLNPRDDISSFRRASDTEADRVSRLGKALSNKAGASGALAFFLTGTCGAISGRRPASANSIGRMMTDKMKLLQRIRDATEALARLERGEVPSIEELSAAPLLEAWYLTERANFLALGGTVFGHPTLPDAAGVRTSCVLWIADNRRAARTISRLYRLGTSLESLIATKQ